MLYDFQGRRLAGATSNGGSADVSLDYRRDTTNNTNYTVIRIAKVKTDGSVQYPFVRAPGRTKADAFAAAENWDVIVNAGVGVSDEQPCDGVVVENGVVKNNDPATYHVGSQPLTIDANGDLGYAEANVTGAALAAQGFVSVVCGFCPIVDNYAAINPLADVNINGDGNHFTNRWPRQIIGQFGNGDYAIVTCEGEKDANNVKFDASDGWTLANAQTVCIGLGLRFAYNLDGGQSVATFLGKKLVSHNYVNYKRYLNNTRLLPTYIVFNGGTKFCIPAAG